jgi:secreted PhoX family phosphatase
MDTYDRADLSARGIAEESTFETILKATLARRSLLGGAAAAMPLLLVGTGALTRPADAAATDLTFEPIAESTADKVRVPEGYRARPIISWGDPLFPGMVPFNINNQTGADQARRFGFNNDMVAVFELSDDNPYARGGFAGTKGETLLMCVNHEYTSGLTMFPDYPMNALGQFTALPTRRQIDAEMEAHGISVILITLEDGRWTYQFSPFNRRITATTRIEISGPVRGDDRMKTDAEPTGTVAYGTLNNCAGGVTPWGTYLSAEENWDQYFNKGDQIADATVKAQHAVYGLSRTKTLTAPSFHRFWETQTEQTPAETAFLKYSRFDLSIATPGHENEPYRFGWIVEVDPYDITGRPAKKRTALGRFKHEAGTCVVAPGNQVVVYSGDDERFEYVYKFVTAGTFDPENPRANMDLLDEGTLYVAKFNDGGTGQWLPLTFAEVEARAPGRFRNQADVLLRCREAGDVMGATPMDRPEDVEAPVDAAFRGNGHVYMVMTNNNLRADPNQITPDLQGLSTLVAPRGRSGFTNGPNPRGGPTLVRNPTTNTAFLSSRETSNVAGHIVEVREAGHDAAALTFRWEILMLAGDPANPLFPDPASGAPQNTDVRGTFTGDRFACPDNIAFDGRNRNHIWIATDGSPSVFPTNDQIVAAEIVDGPKPAKRFLTGPKDCEICGPEFAPDRRTLFCAIQHPGEDGTIVPRVLAGASGDVEVAPTSVWPRGDFPRPSVLAVRRDDGGFIGS